MTLKADQSVESVLAKIAYSINPDEAIHKVSGFLGFTKKANGESVCHAFTANAIKTRKNLTDKLVLLGMKFGNKYIVTHSILVDSNNTVVADSEKDIKTTYVPHNGYYTDKNVMLSKELLVFPIKDFVNEMFYTGRKELSKVEEEFVVDFIKMCYVIFAYSFTEEGKKVELPETLKNNISPWTTNAYAFALQFKIPKVALKNLITAATTNAAFTDKINETVNALGKGFKLAMPKIEKDISIDAEHLKLIKDLGLAFRVSSQSAILRLEKNVSILKDTHLSSLFSVASKNKTTKADKAEVEKQLKKLTKKHAGTNTEKLSIDDAKKLKDKNPEAYKQYTKLRSELKKVSQNFVRDFVRKSGKEYLDVKTVQTALKKEGLTDYIPKGFVGNVDEALNLRTKTGKIIQGAGTDSVTMNPKYDPKKDNTYVFKAGTNNIYTLDYIETKRKLKKEKKMDDLAENNTDYRAKWLKDMKGAESKNKLMATQLEIIFLTGARTGNLGNATTDRNTGETKATYGVTTLKVKHIKKYKEGIRIVYDGKKLGLNDYIIRPSTPTNKIVIKNTLAAMEDKKPNDFVWTWKEKRIPTSAVSMYFKSLGAEHATLHAVRYMLGTQIAKDILKKSPLVAGKATQAEAEKWYKTALLEVGEKLGHTTGNKTTSATAIKSYIDPRVQADFFAKLKLRVPSFLQTKAKT